MKDNLFINANSAKCIYPLSFFEDMDNTDACSKEIELWKCVSKLIRS